MLEHIVSGLTKAGWVILPLILVSVAGWALAFHRLIALRAVDWRGGVLAAVKAAAPDRAAMEAKLDERMKFLVPELEKWLSTLAILASAAPLMGLLGTVSGMVRTFQVISAFGTGNQALMSDSIAESLMATQNGLLVAFPLMLMHVHLSARAEHLEKSTLAAARAAINAARVPQRRAA